MDSKNKVCRICLLLCESTLCIFTSVEVPNLQNTKYPLIDVLRIFTDLPVSPSLPEYICKICLDEIQEAYSFKLKYDTSLTEQPMDNVTKNTDDFHREHEHHADTSIELIKTENDIKEYGILNEEHILIEDSTDEFTELVTLEEEVLSVEEVKEESEIDITDSLNETNPNENNLQCTKIVQSEEILKVHRSVHSDYYPYDCKICPQSFRYEFDLKTHTIRQHGMVRCKLCSKIFESNSLLSQHIIRFHFEMQKFKPFRCDFCANEFEYSGYLERHLRTVHGDGRTRFQSVICEDIFRDEVNWKEHIRTEHPRNFKCTICPKSFQFMSHLNRHMIVHSDVRFQCDICPKEYSHKDSLQAHIKTSHSKKSEAAVEIAVQLQKLYYIQKYNKVVPKKKSFECDICSKKCINEKSLQAHLRTRHSKKSQADQLQEFYKIPKQNEVEQKKKSFQCDIYNTHTIRQHGMVRCKQCSKIFANNSLLKQHIIRFHHLQTEHNDGTRFQCKICQDIFRNEVNWKKHMRTEHPRNFKCTMCSKSFQFKSSLNQHMIVHSDVRYQCDICPNEYSHEEILQAHIRTSHSKKSQAIVEIAAQLQRVYIPKQNKVGQNKVGQNKKSFQCDICPKKYINERNLQAHLRTRHRKNVKPIFAIATQLQKVHDIQKQNEV